MSYHVLPRQDGDPNSGVRFVLRIASYFYGVLGSHRESTFIVLYVRDFCKSVLRCVAPASLSNSFASVFVFSHVSVFSFRLTFPPLCSRTVYSFLLLRLFSPVLIEVVSLGFRSQKVFFFPLPALCYVFWSHGDPLSTHTFHLCSFSQGLPLPVSNHSPALFADFSTNSPRPPPPSIENPP